MPQLWLKDGESASPSENLPRTSDAVLFMIALYLLRIPQIANALRLCPQPLVGLRGQPAGDHLLESGVVHEPGEDLFVLIHPFHEQGFEEVLEDQLELVPGIHDGCLLERLVGGCRLDNLIKEAGQPG